MSLEKAIEIINEERIGNPFTMGLSIDEFIDGFRKRYTLIFNEIVPKDYISVAKCINKLNSNSNLLK